MTALAAFRPVKAPRAFEEIAAQIRRELTAGRLKAGERLPPERDLAQTFGVSRNTLREALRSLENAGLLQFRKGASGGAYVRESTAEAVMTGMRDMYSLGAIRPEHLTEARIWIESAAIRAACERATAADMQALSSNVAEAAQATRADDFYRTAAIHLEFHRLIARATRNPVMVLTMDAILEVMQQFLETIGPTENPYVLPSRRRFLRHMTERDAEAAVAEMEKHLKRLHRHYLSLAGGGAGAA